MIGPLLYPAARPAVIDALGYVPDAAAQSMARQRKEVIGLAAIEGRGPESDIEQEGLLFLEEVLSVSSSRCAKSDGRY